MSHDNQKTQILIDLVKDKIVIDMLQERKSERLWRWIRRGGFAAAFVIAVGMGIVNNIKQSGGWTATGEKIAVIALHGEISDTSQASAKKLVPALRKAFENENVKAIVMDIDSPGGQPQEAERIYSEIDRLRKINPKPIVSVISAQGASAAYLVAIHTDKIYAGEYSMVGSIGALITGWDFSEVANKVGIGRRTITSGKFKDLLNPFREMTDEEKQKVSELVRAMADQFIAEVIEKRKHDPEFQKRGQDVFTGQVWAGREAQSLGLIDDVKTLEEVTQGYGLKVADFGPAAGGGGLFSIMDMGAISDMMTTQIVELSNSGMNLK